MIFPFWTNVNIDVEESEFCWKCIHWISPLHTVKPVTEYVQNSEEEKHIHVVCSNNTKCHRKKKLKLTEQRNETTHTESRTIFFFSDFFFLCCSRLCVAFSPFQKHRKFHQFFNKKIITKNEMEIKIKFELTRAEI